MSNNNIKTYLSAGKKIIPLNGKVPIEKDWPNLNLSEGKLSKHSGNFGWALSGNDVVVDVDPRNGGDDSFKKLTKDLGIELEPTVMTASGGFHIYLKKTGDALGKKTKKKLSQYPGIDFLSEGAQCVIVGSSIDGKFYTWHDELGGFEQNPAPAKLIEIISDDRKSSKSFESLINQKNSSWTESQVLELLNKLDPSMCHEEWFKVGMAIHDWDSERGLALWEDWSKNGDNYEAGVTEAKWRSFKNNADGISFGTLVHMARGVDFETDQNFVQDIISKIKDSDEKNLRLEIAKKVQKSAINDIDLEKIVKIFQTRLKELTGAKIPITDIRSMLAPKGNRDGELSAYNQECSHIFCDIVYVNAMNSYVDIITNETYSAAAFNQKFGKYLPISESGSKPAATKFTADRGLIKVVNSTVYMPQIKDRFFKLDGIERLNRFNPNTTPETATEYTEAGKETIGLIIRHVNLIFNEERAPIFLQWLAHQVQNTGEILGWAILLQSKQGLGKTFMGNVLRACLGNINVGTVSPTQVGSNFNGWATNVAVNIFEELKIAGQNRHVALNAVKPLVTDKIIQINEKNVKPYVTYNTANIVCFTNHKNSIPMDEDDRRWWVIFSPFDSIEDFENEINEKAELYFDKLYSGLDKHAPEIRKWLLEYPISQEFKAIKRAPVTDEKLSMIATETHNIDFLEEFLDEINESLNPYVDANVISSSHFFNRRYDIHGREIGRMPTAQQKNAILLRLGYRQMPKTVKFRNEVLRIWTKKKMTNDEVRQYLNNKIGEEPTGDAFDTKNDELDDL